MKKVAVLYQGLAAPLIDGVLKPMKPGGYADSGADLAFSLKSMGLPIVTPTPFPEERVDKDWVFPDTHEGIREALALGAQILWLNTVLYDSHPIIKFQGKGLEIIGQPVHIVDTYDNKWLANELLRNHDIPVPDAWLIEENDPDSYDDDWFFPMVLKPIRGRGSQGVVVVNDPQALKSESKNMFKSKLFGTKIYAETYLSGREITLSVMPPGSYTIDGRKVVKDKYWCLSPILRFNHLKGIAPYSGNIAVVKNSRIFKPSETSVDQLNQVMTSCEKAANLVGAKAPIRIDCREDEKGRFYLFDLNLKPNMTGSSRRHRKDQDSLTAIAAKNIGWSYNDLNINIFHQKWLL